MNATELHAQTSSEMQKAKCEIRRLRRALREIESECESAMDGMQLLMAAVVNSKIIATRALKGKG